MDIIFLILMLLKIIFSCKKDSMLVSNVESAKYAGKLKDCMFSLLKFCNTR